MALTRGLLRTYRPNHPVEYLFTDEHYTSLYKLS